MSDPLQARGVDFHCHLDLFPDFEAAIARAERAQVYTLSVTTTPKAWKRNLELTKDTRFVRAALGLHPQLAAERADELPLWEALLDQTRYVGEVGLDAGPKYYRSLDRQKLIFGAILRRCAGTGGKILSVHSIRSVPIVLDMIAQYLPPGRGKVVLHWFTGTKAEAARAATMGCYFSVNAAMARSERGRAIVSSIPPHRILTETDGPFTQSAGRPAEPADALQTVESIASVRHLPIKDATNLVLDNLRDLLTV
ncbi:MAG TPA: TatD family hydrolase [Hyphomicrobiaceae bacterium]|nr:TatD family hydrolase [Hyphomicrobiaceae bacterium]